MKKITLIIIALVITALVFTGCTGKKKEETEDEGSSGKSQQTDTNGKDENDDDSQSGLPQIDTTFFEFFGDDTVEWAKNFHKNPPKSLTVYVDHCEYAQEPQVFTDKEFITEVFTALSKITVNNKTGSLSDTGTVINYVFETDSAQEYSFSFHYGELLYQKDLFNISNASALFGIEEIIIDN